MALLATTLTTEVILLLIGLYIFDGGIVRKIGAIGLFSIGLQLSYSSQKYVSDLTTTPSNVSLFFTPELQRAWVILFALLILITFALFAIQLGKIIKFRRKGGIMTFKDLTEELI